MVGGRSPQIEESTLEILSEETIKVYLIYLDQLKNLFTQYIHQNFNAKKKIISWRDIEDKNSRMVVSAFLKMCRCKHLIPTMFNVECLEEMIIKIIPPMTAEEYDYLEENKELIKVHNEDTNFEQTTCEPKDGEPGLLFHEFVFMLGLIAVNFMSTDALSSTRVEDFFIEKLGFKKMENEKRAQKTYDEVLRRVQTDGGDDGEDIFTDEEGLESEESELDENQKAF